MSKTLIESALRVLLHARHGSGHMRVQTRALIRHDIKMLRKLGDAS
jgi:hypothetical protein